MNNMITKAGDRGVEEIEWSDPVWFFQASIHSGFA